MKKRIGIFGGTFDPIHLGHLNLALELAEHFALERVYLSPCYCSPHKMDAPPLVSSEKRLEMVRMVIQDYPSFAIFPYELESRNASYTVNALKKLRELHPEEDLFFLMGADASSKLDRWHSIEEIFELATPLIGHRVGEFSLKQPNLPKKYLEIISNHTIGIPIFDISSTYIRKRLKEKKPCHHLLPSKVLDFIYQHSLYLVS